METKQHESQRKSKCLCSVFHIYWFFFKNEGGIKSFSDKWKMREYVASKTVSKKKKRLNASDWREWNYVETWIYRKEWEAQNIVNV